MNPNPFIRFYGGLAYGSDMEGLRSAIAITSGLKYGYMPHEMIDTGIITCTLTLCGKTRISKIQKAVVESTIKGYAIGRGFGTIYVKWE